MFKRIAFSFYLNNAVDPGAGAYFTVLSRNTYTYSGTSTGTSLTGNAINPTALRDEGVDSTSAESVLQVGSILNGTGNVAPSLIYCM